MFRYFWINNFPQDTFRLPTPTSINNNYSYMSIQYIVVKYVNCYKDVMNDSDLC